MKKSAWYLNEGVKILIFFLILRDEGILLR